MRIMANPMIRRTTKRAAIKVAKSKLLGADALYGTREDDDGGAVYGIALDGG